MLVILLCLFGLVCANYEHGFNRSPYEINQELINIRTEIAGIRNKINLLLTNQEMMIKLLNLTLQ